MLKAAPNQFKQAVRRSDFQARDRDTSLVSVCGSQSCTPIPVWLRVNADFLWQRSPYSLTADGAGTIETAGIDYILPYWMARYYKLVP